jgi:predicted dehydrogenase
MTAPRGVGRVGIGVAGAGNISSEYLRNLTAFPDLDVRFVADLDTERAAAQAAAFGVPGSGSLADLLADDGVELVVNLTHPAAHAEVSLAALDAGKHAWSEKPLATTREDGRAIVDRVRSTGLRMGCAPDTFLGPGLQAARRLVSEGGIGTPLSALALFQNPGPERWHPNPAFLFATGAGPLFDLGPYYLTALVQLLGPIARVTAHGSRGQGERLVHSGPKAGETFPVEVDTDVQALLEFRGGASALAVFSFDSPLQRTLLEVTGPTGSLEVPDPNRFTGDLRVHRHGEALETIKVPDEHPSRGIGVLDLARAIRGGRTPRASVEQGFHVLDAMVSIAESAARGAPVELDSDYDVPSPVELGWDPAAATLG